MEAIKYTSNKEIEEIIKKDVDNILNNNYIGLEKVVKNTPTELRLPGQGRYEVGKTLVTYVGVDENNELIMETWGGGKAKIEKDSVILRNVEPIRDKKGDLVWVLYNENGEAKIVNENTPGAEILYNEYVSNTEFVEKFYKLEDKLTDKKWVKGLKTKNPIFARQVDQDFVLALEEGSQIEVKKGGWLIYHAKEGKVTVSAISEDWFEKTYKRI